MRLLSGVTFDGRAAWGETENADHAVEMGETLTNRRLVRAKLTGTREVEGWKVAPSVGLVYLEDAVRDDTTGATKAASTGRIEVLPAGGINRFTAADVIERTGCDQVHASLSMIGKDLSASNRPQVSFGGVIKQSEVEFTVTDADAVRKLRGALAR